jgi:hypothetical protein
MASVSFSVPAGLFPFPFVGNGEFLSSAGTTSGNHSPSIGCGHPLSETVFIGALAPAWLVGPLHD